MDGRMQTYFPTFLILWEYLKTLCTQKITNVHSDFCPKYIKFHILKTGHLKKRQKYIQDF